jgi:DNA-binding transcriptional MerR regulator
MATSPSPFDDGKDPGALRTIGEVAKALKIRQHVLRYWEQHFPMLSPLKRSGGRRLYRPEDVALVVTIDRMVNQEGFTLRGARLALEKRGKSAVEIVETPAATAAEPAAAAAPDPGPLFAAAAPAVPADVVVRLKDIRARLAAALEA